MIGITELAQQDLDSTEAVGEDERMVVVLVAHDNRKQDLVAWARFNRETLAGSCLYATRTTGQAVEAEVGLTVHGLLSGPLGGDAQVGSMIAEGRADMVIFLWDPLTPQPHDVDVKTLLRLAVLYDVPIACNRSSADFLISSPLMREYRRYREERRTRELVAALPASLPGD
jgi:methylglyoxal synthase